MLERIIASQINGHRDIVGTLPSVPSAYRRNVSMETTLTGVISYLLMVADVGDMSVLELLDLSIAFDTVDHSFDLHIWFCHNGLALNPDKTDAIFLVPPSVPSHSHLSLPSLSLAPLSHYQKTLKSLA